MTTHDPRVLAFRAKKIKHESLRIALDSLLRFVEYPRPEQVVVLIGPSGVGKSTIVAAVERHMRAQYAAEMQSDPGFLPYLSLKAHAPLDGNFNWKDFFTRALCQAGEILIDRKFAPSMQIELDGATVSGTKGLVREELRRSVETMIRHRRVQVIIVDEASAILFMKSGLDPTLQFNILKSLAIELRIPIILVGAYDLLGILDGSGQLVRRSDVVHVPRYMVDAITLRVPDVQHFTNALAALMGAIDIPKEEGLTRHTHYFMLKSVGCVGVLKDWLDRALCQALRSDKPVLSREVLERSALPNNAIARLTQEAMAGELRFADVPDDDLAALAGFKITPSLQPGESPSSATTPAVKRRGRVGLRGPSRDVVGANHG
jgi:energy-coupling factor transporter ATP-binding protein EcfA2